MKCTLIALAAGLTLLLPTAAAQAGPSLWINGQSASGVAYVREGTTYVSLRSVAQQLDETARIGWEDGRATVEGEGVSLTAAPGEQWLTVNGRCLYIPDGVQVEQGRVLVPIRVLAEAFGAQVTWRADTARVLVETAGSPAKAGYDQEEVEWLSRIISAESSGESLEGQIAVGNVVLNRVASRDFPDTIYEVIFDERWGGQFEPVRNGSIYAQPEQQCVVAAKLCLEGASTAGESLYFLDPDRAENLWTVQNRLYLLSIGVHDFYL